MSRILGIDYGRKKIGLALAESASFLAAPFGVLKVTSNEEAISKLVKVIEVEEIDEIVIGVSEGEMAQEAKDFGGKLQEVIPLPIHFSDETLSSQEAESLSISAGIKRKKRKEMEDAYAATILLQNHLDTLA